jgi:hypothetical protein
MAKTDWHSRPRSEKFAAVMYPGLVPEEVRREMALIAKGENRRAPAGPSLLNDKTRGAVSPLGGQARVGK